MLRRLLNQYDKNGNKTYEEPEVRAIVNDLLDSIATQLKLKKVACVSTITAVLAVVALIILAAALVLLIGPRDYDKQSAGDDLPAFEMNGNLVGTRAVTTTLPLLAAIAMDMVRLEQVKSIGVSFLLSGTIPSPLLSYGPIGLPLYGVVKKTYHVASVMKVSDTAVVFVTAEAGHSLVITDGSATVHAVGADGNVTKARVCTLDLSCGALKLDSTEEKAALMDKALGALGPSEARRLQAGDCFDPGDKDYTSYTCPDGETTVCAEAKKIENECGPGDEACRKDALCDHPNICDTWKDQQCNSTETGRRELFSEDECADTPDELLAEEAGRLGLPAESCAELLGLGACELDMVKVFCAKTCGACGGGSKRRLAKCGD